jgi:biotin transport system substrate-specific component
VATSFRLKAEGWTLAGGQGGRVVRLALEGALAVMAVTLAARLAVPVPGTPVPITLQDLTVLAVGLLLGPTRGAAAIVSYVTLGALGAPVFSNGHAGLTWLMGPTGGYLLAYPASAWVAGTAGRLGRGRARWAVLLVGILAAQVVLFGGGAIQLALLTGRGFASTATLAVTPFVPGIVVKTGLLTGFGMLVAGRRAPRSGRVRG